MPSPNTLAIAAAVGAIAYFGYFKPRRARTRTQGGGSTNPSGPPKILFSTDCAWEIPDVWWSDVGQPKFTSILESALSGATTWEEKMQVMGTDALNSHVVAHKVLEGEVAQGCPLPPVGSDVFNPPPTLTVPEDRMLNLFAHMINHVEASLVEFAKSEGSVVQFPVPLP